MRHAIKKPKEKLISKKEAGFIKDYLLTGNGTMAALRNYDTKSENSAAVIAHRTLRKAKIKKIIKSFADGIPDELLREKHLELLTVPRKVRIFTKGKLTYEYEEIDSNALGKGLDMAYKIKNFYKNEPEKPDTGVDETLESINTLIKMVSDKQTTVLNKS